MSTSAPICPPLPPAAAAKVLEVVLAAAESLSVFSERGRVVPETRSKSIREVSVYRCCPTSIAATHDEFCYITTMSGAAHKLVTEALQLSEDERLAVASELIASVDGPADADWDAVWLAELERRRQAAESRGQPAPEWSEVRSRILDRLARR